MRQLGPQGMRWLKLLHVVGAAVWVGSGFALLFSLTVLSAADGRELHGKLAILDFIDLFVLVPGAFVSLFTGIAYSIWTPWGWFKHRWVAVKWLICASGIAIGYAALGPWLSGLVRLSADQGLAALEHPSYPKLLWFIAYQAATLVAALVLTVFRPWRKRAGPAGNPRTTSSVGQASAQGTRG